MKKTIFFLSLMVGLFVSSFAFMACSSDNDDEVSSDSLVGTWIVTSTDDEDIPFNTSLTIHANGNITYPGMQSGDYLHYTITGTSLRIDMGEDGPDDSLLGTFTLSGNNLTYTYHWKDYDGKWESDKVYTLKLTKK